MAKKTTVADLEFETDYQFASVADQLSVLNDLVDIMWNQLANLEMAVYEKPKRKFFRR
jgi:hypothetical protein